MKGTLEDLAKLILESIDKMTPEEKASVRRSLVGDLTVEWLRRKNLPVTLENWLSVNYPGDLTPVIDAEFLASLPDELFKRD